MLVREILRRKPNQIISFIGADDPVLDAVRFMNDNRIGSLLARNEAGDVVGIVTERDILRAVAKDLDGLKEKKVADLMTKDLICGLADDDSNYVMLIMTRNKIRHLPVVHEGKIIGLISIGDLISCQLEETQVQKRTLHDLLELSGKL
ncbi:MAG: inosine 5'-monophosphate dehydrogenase [candidate division BRC1 bacterium ADurb.BinA364]|nr:MAG: inosine 5'-monophosphate dehydrogenase [candidate division BRC1 bacterium ADurb.BinA364]